MSTPRLPELGLETMSERSKRQTDRPKILEERRRFKRMDVSLNGRFMVENTDEYPCEVFNMSPGGMAVKAPFSPRVGERVISYIEQLGGLDGRSGPWLVRPADHLRHNLCADPVGCDGRRWSGLCKCAT